MESWRRGNKILSWEKHTLKRAPVPPGKAALRYAVDLFRLIVPAGVSCERNEAKLWAQQHGKNDGIATNL